MKRCDHLPLLDANPGKVRALREVLAAFRAAAPDMAIDQWQRFFEKGRFNKMVSAGEEARSARLARAKSESGAARMQMLRYQVVGQLESFIENRANDFRDTVFRSSIDDATRHQLLTINKLHAWFCREPVFLGKSKANPGVLIEDDIRHLTRSIMRAVLRRHRRPRFNRINPWIDQRQAQIGSAETAAHAPIWVDIRGMRREIGKTASRRRRSRRSGCL